MAWFRLLLAVVARVLLGLTASLVLCSLAPTLLGWQSHVVVTGSMLPTLRPGDVIAYQPTPASRVQPGQIILARDPVRPGHLLSHRFTRRLADGQLVTRGDANGHEDSTPIPQTSVIGVARLDIPRVGVPFMWWNQGQKGRAVATALGLLVAAFLASSGSTSPHRTRAEHAEEREQHESLEQPEPTRYADWSIPVPSHALVDGPRSLGPDRAAELS